MDNVFGIPGARIFQYFICMGGFAVLLYSHSDVHVQRITYCNKYCGRGQLFGILGGKLGLSGNRNIFKRMRSKWFRYGFLTFFFAMFFLMIWNTWLVFSGVNELKQAVQLLWTFKLPWNWAYHGTIIYDGVAQFSSGFYSIMLTSTVLGFVTMLLFKPRSWCVYCPMGTMTQLICKAKNK